MLGNSNSRWINLSSKWALRAAAAVVVAAAIFVAPSSASAQSGPPSGSVTLHVGQAGYIGSVSKGEGVLHFQGQDYPFEVAGAGVGGLGLTRFDGQGPVYNLKSVAGFPGPFAQVRTGLSIGAMGKGKMMLRNRNGVVIQLKGKRKGFSLSTGADAMVVSFSK